jgi:hypothetical protein
MSRTERKETNNKNGTVTITTKYIVKKDGSSVAVVRTKREPTVIEEVGTKPVHSN